MNEYLNPDYLKMIDDCKEQVVKEEGDWFRILCNVFGIEAVGAYLAWVSEQKKANGKH